MVRARVMVRVKVRSWRGVAKEAEAKGQGRVGRVGTVLARDGENLGSGQQKEKGHHLDCCEFRFDGSCASRSGTLVLRLAPMFPWPGGVHVLHTQSSWIVLSGHQLDTPLAVQQSRAAYTLGVALSSFNAMRAYPDLR